MIKITDKDFSVDKIVKKMKHPEIGCIVNFTGIVRETSQEGTVETLEIEVYREMAKKKLVELVKQAKKQFEINDVSIVHRIGKLKVSENIVCIVVSAAHRKAAFKACEWIIDELKKWVPIWKTEKFIS